VGRKVWGEVKIVIICLWKVCWPQADRPDSWLASLPNILPAAGPIELLSIAASQLTYLPAAGLIEPTSLPARSSVDFNLTLQFVFSTNLP